MQHGETIVSSLRHLKTTETIALETSGHQFKQFFQINIMNFLQFVTLLSVSVSAAPIDWTKFGSMTETTFKVPKLTQLGRNLLLGTGALVGTGVVVGVVLKNTKGKKLSREIAAAVPEGKAAFVSA